MNILSALRSNPEDSTSEAEAALSEFHSAEQRRNEIATKNEVLQGELAVKRREHAGAIYAGSNAVSTLEADIIKLETEISRNEIATRVASSKMAEAQRHLHKIGAAGQIKTLKRLTNKRLKYSTELVDALSAYAKAYAKVIECNDQIASFWPFGPVPEGCLLDRAFDAAIPREILRITGAAGTLEHRIPGAETSPFLGPDDLTPLGDEIAQANGRLLALLEAGPDPLPAPIPEAWAPVTETSLDNDPDAELLGAPSQRGQDANVIFSTTGPAKQVLIDHRKGGDNAA
jgi:hypothetical protein